MSCPTHTYGKAKKKEKKKLASTKDTSASTPSPAKGQGAGGRDEKKRVEESNGGNGRSVGAQRGATKKVAGSELGAGLTVKQRSRALGDKVRQN